MGQNMKTAQKSRKNLREKKESPPRGRGDGTRGNCAAIISIISMIYNHPSRGCKAGRPGSEKKPTKYIKKTVDRLPHSSRGPPRLGQVMDAGKIN